MNRFKYKAVRMDGKIMEDVVVADSEQEALQVIKAAQLFPLELKPDTGTAKSSRKIDPQKIKVSPPARIQFTKSLYTLIKAGVPILGALKVILEQEENNELKIIVNACIQDISTGKSFSESLSRFPQVFSRIYIQTIQVGEFSGTFEEALKYLAELEEKDYRLKKELKKSLRYPIFTLIAIVIAFFVFTLFVFPNFVPLFQATNMDLPLPTRLLMGTSTFMLNYWWLLLLLSAAVVSAIWHYARTEAGRQIIESRIFKLPIFGRLIRFTLLARYIRMLFTLFKAGVPIVQALEIVEQGVDSAVLKQETRNIIQSLSAGKPFTEQLMISQVFDPFAVQMLKIGEESGALEPMLQYVGNFYEKEVNEMVENLNTTIEPVLTVLLGGMVVFLALSLFLPMWNLMGALK